MNIFINPNKNNNNSNTNSTNNDNSQMIIGIEYIQYNPTQ